MKKILIIPISTLGFSKMNGIINFIQQNLAMMPKYFDCTLLIPGKYDQTLLEPFNQLGFHLHFVAHRQSNPLRYFYNLHQEMSKQHYDAIYIHGSSGIVYLDCLLALLHNIPNRIIHSHNTTTNHHIVHPILSFLLQWSSTFQIACSPAAGKWLFRNHSFQLLWNGRDFQKYAFQPHFRNQQRAKYHITEETIVIGHVGNFTKEKNYSFFIPFLQQLSNQPFPFKVVFCGDGPLYLSFQQELQQKNLLSNVIFTGTSTQIQEIYAMMDCLLLPSFHEGNPLCILEAQISGLPCLINLSLQECILPIHSEVHFIPVDQIEKWCNILQKVDTSKRLSRIQQAKHHGQLASLDLYDQQDQIIQLWKGILEE